MSSLKKAGPKSPAVPGQDAVLRYVGTVVRSRREVEAFLARRGVPAAEQAGVLAACEARGLINDAAAARLWAQHWLDQGYAWAAVRERLRTKGIDDRTLHSLDAQDRFAGEDESSARRVAARLRGRSAAAVARALALRGFDPDVIERVVSDTFGSSP